PLLGVFGPGPAAPGAPPALRRQRAPRAAAGQRAAVLRGAVGRRLDAASLPSRAARPHLPPALLARAVVRAVAASRGLHVLAGHARAGGHVGAPDRRSADGRGPRRSAEPALAR